MVNRRLPAAACCVALALMARAACALPAPLELEDRPQPLAAQRPRTEADEDRVEALALFAAGRTWEQRQMFDKALRCYERAQRRDPAAGSILEALVLLAEQLNQDPVAVRYALRAGDAENVRPLLLLRLGVDLARAGRIPQAIAMYEKYLAARLGAKPDADDVLLWMELGRLYYRSEQYPKAAEQFTRVLGALEHPDKFELDEKLRKKILGKPGPAYQLFGECYLLCGRVREAAAALEKSQALAPNEALWKYSQARIAAREGKPEQALADLEASFAKSLAGEGLAPYELLAEVLKKLGREK
jgi:tetratricopeptide (TPR) repeat protein